MKLYIYRIGLPVAPIEVRETAKNYVTTSGLYISKDNLDKLAGYEKDRMYSLSASAGDLFSELLIEKYQNKISELENKLEYYKNCLLCEQKKIRGCIRG